MTLKESRAARNVAATARNNVATAGFNRGAGLNSSSTTTVARRGFKMDKRLLAAKKPE